MDYQDIAQGLGLQAGDRVWLSSELVKTALLFRREGKTFDGSRLLDAFQQVLGPSGTLLVPTFTFAFSNTGQYDVRGTKGTVGALGNIALARSDFRRTQHPMHSFAVWGQDSEALAAMANRHAFGPDSPFGYCVGSRVTQVILGTDYVHAMTFVHYAETVCNVPYRFAKSFTGLYTDENGRTEQRTYDYAARRLELDPQERFDRIGRLLEEKGIAEKRSVGGIPCYRIDLAASLPVLCDDIVNNQCRNIYDFNVGRERIFR